jgi:hypothetical protein
MKRQIVAFRKLYSKGTEEWTSEMIKITTRYDAAQLVTFVRLQDIKFGKS